MRLITLLGLLLTLFLAALDQTIVATALPRITAELGGMAHYAWVTTAYLLTSTVMVPIAGKLSDQLGRKPLLVFGSLSFLVTSLLCAQAQDFTQLVAARALQGIGGGTITAAVFATVPTLFSPAGRARIVGLFTGTYGLASIIGPLIGGLVTDAVGWRGVFFLNLPLGVLALILLLRFYRPLLQAVIGSTRLDYAGTLTLVGGLVPLLLALSVGGHELAWTSPILIGLLVISAVLISLFIRVELRAPEPIVPFQLLRSRSVGIPTLGMLFLSGGLFATSLFTPLFVQSVIGSSATSSGSVLAPMMLAFVAGSVLIGQLIARVPRYRVIGMLGLFAAATGEWLLAGMGPDTGYTVVARNLVVVGFGLGGALSAFAVATQNAVPIAQMGVATALGTSGRAMGSTLASAGFGSLLAARLSTSAASPELLASALRDTFSAVVVLLCLGAAVVLLLEEAPLRKFPSVGHSEAVFSTSTR